MDDGNQRFLSIAEVTRKLGISVRSLSRLRENGAGPPFVRIGRRVTYNPVRLAEWIDRQESASALNAATEQ